MTTKADQQREKRGATFTDFAKADSETPLGRFTAHEKSVLVTGEVPVYPQGAAWSADPVGPEPPLGIDVNEMPPTGEPHEVAASIAAQPPLEPAPGPSPAVVTGGPTSADAPLPPLDVQRADVGPPSFKGRR